MSYTQPFVQTGVAGAITWPGSIGSCPAVVNAIVDGLWREYKIDHIDMPATPARVWETIKQAKANAA